MNAAAGCGESGTAGGAGGAAGGGDGLGAGDGLGDGGAPGCGGVPGGSGATVLEGAASVVEGSGAGGTPVCWASAAVAARARMSVVQAARVSEYEGRVVMRLS